MRQHSLKLGANFLLAGYTHGATVYVETWHCYWVQMATALLQKLLCMRVWVALVCALRRLFVAVCA